MTDLTDEDIRKEVLGWRSLDGKDVNQTIGFIEAKELARATTQLASMAQVSS